MSTMTQIRTTIELLAVIFKENGCSKIKAETFRLAKFNSDEAVAPLWKLLFELTYYCDNGKIDDICSRATTELLPEEIVAYVKRRAISWNYFSHDLADLPNDMSSGSRELLLLLGWVMCKDKIISKFIDNRTEALNEDTAYLYKENNQQAPALATFCQKPAGSYEKLQQLVLLNNKLQMSLKSLFALQMEKNILRHKIHEATMQGQTTEGRGHLSMLEMYMLQHPELLKSNIELLEKDNERLQNLVKWRDNDDVWWQWMDSVLDAKLADKKTTEAASGEVGDDPTDVASENSAVPLDLSSRLEDIQSELNATVSRYENVLHMVEQLASSKQVTADEIDTIISSIDVDVAIQEAALIAAERQSQLNGWVAEPVFELRKQEPRSSNVRSKPQEASREPRAEDDLHDIESDLESLRGALSDLQVQMTSEQQQFRQQMETLCGQLDGILCIPPPMSTTTAKLAYVGPV